MSENQQSPTERARLIRYATEAAERAEKHGNTEGVWLFAKQWRVVAEALASQAAQPAEADGVERNIEAQRQTIEACAKVADRIASDYRARVRETNGEYDEDANALGVAAKVAAAIRALRPNESLAATPKAPATDANPREWNGIPIAPQGKVSTVLLSNAAPATDAGEVARPALPMEAVHAPDCEHPRAPIWMCKCPRPVLAATPPAPNDDLRAAVEAVIALDTRDPNDLRQSDITRGFASGVRRCATILRAALKENRRD